MAPRKAAPTIGRDALASAVEGTCPGAWVTRAREGENFIDYKAMDMKKGVDYLGLLKHSFLSGGIQK